MSFVKQNTVDPHIDIQGTTTVANTRPYADEQNLRGAGIASGTGDSLSAPDGNGVQTFTDTGAAFTVADVGRFIDFSGFTGDLDNNGVKRIVSRTSGTVIGVLNPDGGAETAACAWATYEPYTLADDINFERTDRKNIKGTAQHYSAIPTYERPTAVGTARDKNLTNLVSVDQYATVRDVQQVGVALRPGINDVDGTVATGDETFTTTKYHFTAADLNSFLTLVCAADASADGTYRIKVVTDGKTVELDGLAATGAGGTATWSLLSGVKGILSSRGYADATDRTGIPIADSGAEDATVFNATFVDMVNPLHMSRPSTNAELPIWARSFGDAADVKKTATNEGVRFFAQLETGANDGTASAATLEMLSGRSGSAAALAGSNKTITGLTGMVDEDVGRYITLYNCNADNAGHYKIATVVSGTSVTVVRGSNFAADGTTVKWSVSKHQSTWDFYNGDRYRNDQLSETWGRATLIGGIVTDAELAQELANLREFCGEDLSQTAPTINLTTSFYPLGTDVTGVWGLVSPTNSNLEEIINSLNKQIGNRDYVNTLLSDGQTVTASLEALAAAISFSDVTRTIERLAGAASKNVAHPLPNPLVYTLDGTGNGRNMWVFWRGLLRDPGTVAAGDDYAETSTSSITPFSEIKAGDHISYLILK